jgi:hypothetical protein
MMIRAVHQGDARPPVIEVLAKGKPAKAGAQHDHVHISLLH